MTYQLLQGDAEQQLRTLPRRSVQTIVTSPPYLGLRNYGQPGQIGLEGSIDAYVARLVDVFRAARDVLADDGTLWLNLGDTYVTRKTGTQGGTDHRAGRRHTAERLPPKGMELPEKNLIGIPWRVALALQADGWILRSDVIWHKGNPTPESTRDRPTRAHEYVFLLSKRARYAYYPDAVAEPLSGSSLSRLAQDLGAQRGSDRVHGGTREGRPMKAVGRPQLLRALQLAREAGLTAEHLAAARAVGLSDAGKAMVTQTGAGRNAARTQQLAQEAKDALGGYFREFVGGATRNRRSVWTINTRPYKGAHFATYPAELARTCLLATSLPGQRVLDPFNGSGTTGEAALTTNRTYTGIDLNPDYLALAHARLAPLAAQAPLIGDHA